jgi:GT2 family glycosyltransferase
MKLDQAVSVVIISHNEGAELRSTVDAILGTLTPDSEIIVVDDSSTDGSAEFLASGYHGVRLIRPAERLGALRARNAGGALAMHPVIVFADAHVVPSADWIGQFISAFTESDVAAVGPGISMMGQPGTTAYGHVWADPALNWRWLPKKSDEPYEIPMIAGCFYAMRKEVFAATGGFDEGLLIWGTGDSELSLRLWLLGYRCLIVPGVDVAHRFKEAHNFPLGWELVLHNMLRSAAVHFNQHRLAQVISAIRNNNEFPAALGRLLLSDVWERRDDVRRSRTRDDDWYFDYFGLQWPSDNSLNNANRIQSG